MFCWWCHRGEWTSNRATQPAGSARLSNIVNRRSDTHINNILYFCVSSHFKRCHQHFAMMTHTHTHTKWRHCQLMLSQLVNSSLPNLSLMFCWPIYPPWFWHSFTSPNFLLCTHYNYHDPIYICHFGILAKNNNFCHSACIKCSPIQKVVCTYK